MEETKTHADPQEYYDYLKKIKGLADVSILNYISTYYRHFVKLEINQKNIDRFIQSKNNNSVVRGFMKSYLEFLKLDKVFDLPIVKTGRKPKKIIRDISKSDLLKIQRLCYNKSVKEGVMFDVLYCGALRRDEVTKVKTNSFLWNKWLNDTDQLCVLHITGKGKKDRNVLVYPETMKTILSAYLDKGLINTNMTKENIATKLNNIDDQLIKKKVWSVWDTIKKRSKEAIGRDVRPHEIRHARATELLENGASVRDIQIYLGHSNLQTTEIYLHEKESASIDRISHISKDL